VGVGVEDTDPQDLVEHAVEQTPSKLDPVVLIEQVLRAP